MTMSEQFRGTQPRPEMDDEDFRNAALRNTDELIRYEYHDQNVDIQTARELLGKDGNVIGPPVGEREYLEAVYSLLMARCPLEGDEREEFEGKTREQLEHYPTQDDAIRAGKLGVYNRYPQLNAVAALSQTTDEYAQEVRKIEQESMALLRELSFADPEFIFERLHEKRALIMRLLKTVDISMPSPVLQAAPSAPDTDDGPDMSV